MPRPRFRHLLYVGLSAIFYFTIVYLVKDEDRSEDRRRSEKKVLFFLKTHKCASTTVQNILLRYAMSRDLDLALPGKANYLGNPYPFSRGFIPPDLRTPDGRYDMFLVHTRLNVSEMKAVMRDGAVWVTVMRDPAALFNSMFHFYHFERRFDDKSLETVLKSPELVKQREKWTRNQKTRFGINQMAWDLGLEEADFENKAKVEELVSMVKANFHLVMIAEYMEVSVILLADLMKWQLEDVAFLTLLSRPRDNDLPAEAKSKLLQLNSADTILYKAFLADFKRRVEDYGVQRMEAQVRRLLEMNIALKRYCVDRATNTGYAKTITYSVRNMANDTCMYVTKNELTFVEELRQERRLKLGALGNFKKLVDTGG